jgi:hypothetical protein
MMPSLDDPRWAGLNGGYRIPYDPRPALRQLEANWLDQSAWSELSQELHHQADVGEASYAAVPALVAIGRRVPERGWNFYGLLATIEAERHARDNPAIPNWLVDEYRSAWADLLSLALDDVRTTRDPYVVQTALAVISLAKGLTKLGFLILGLDESELDELLEENAGWRHQYDADRLPRIIER